MELALDLSADFCIATVSGESGWGRGDRSLFFFNIFFPELLPLYNSVDL